MVGGNVVEGKYITLTHFMNVAGFCLEVILHVLDSCSPYRVEGRPAVIRLLKDSDDKLLHC